jgi:hypothetical protein
MRIAFAFAVAIVTLLAGCDLLDPCAGPEYLEFAVVRHGMLPNGSPTLGSTAPLWGASETLKPSDEIQIISPEGDALPLDVLELVDSNETSVAFHGEDMFVPTNSEACDHNERHYALESVTVGDYTLIHRRENGTGDPLNCIDLDCPWTTFDGSQAVTLTISIR